MKLTPLILAGLLAVSGCLDTTAQQASSDPLPVLELANGFWFDGRDFEPRTMYSVGGVLQSERPAAIDRIIELAGGYVVPPYGEGHTHRPANPNRFEEDSAFFLDDGIFYVMNHGNLASYNPEFADLVSDSPTIDAQFAGALIASPQSHGVELWERLVRRGSFPGVDPDSLDGNAFFVLDSAESLHDNWQQYLETGPDFVKIMVEYSEEYVTRSNDPKYFGQSGLHPRLVPQIVERAHDAGLRVSAHIETAADFRIVVDAGVDVIAHLPGYDIPLDADDERYQIRPDDAASARTKNITVITTTILGVDRADGDEQKLRKIQRIQQSNLAVLKRENVSIAAGSDQFSRNSVDEVLNLSELGGFDNLTLLKMLCEVTPKTVFPEREIGSLNSGMEASFLVLRSNPLNNLHNLRDIRIRFKNGRVIPGEEQESANPGASRHPDLVIRDCQLVSLTDGNTVPNQTVAIKDGVITSVGPSDEDTGYPATTQVIDGTGKFLMPGLIDMHVHIGHPSELTSYLLHGVTTVCNLGGDYVDLFSDARIDMCDLRAQVASGQVAGPRIFTAGQALDGDPRTGPFQRALSSPAAAVEAVLEQNAEGFDFIKIYDAVDEPTLEAIVRTARESDLAVIGHIPEQPGVEKTLNSGIQLIAHAEEFYPVFDGVADIESTARELAARVKRSGVSVIPNSAFVRRIIAQLEDLPAVLDDPQVELLAPRVRRWWTPDYNWYTGRENPEEYLTETRAKYRWLIPLVRELHRADVPLLTGTDAAIPGALPGFAMFEEFRDLQSAGLSPLEILQTATLNSGGFLSDHAGGVKLAQVREGYAADLLLLERNPLDGPDQWHESISGVLFNGRFSTRQELQQRLQEQTRDFR